MFDALVLEKNDDFNASVRQVDDSFLPDGDVTVDIHYSTLNYKDGLAITNRSPVVRDWPMVAGIDGAGIVRASENPAWRPGDAVILNGFGVGEKHKGCLAQRAPARRLAGAPARGIEPAAGDGHRHCRLHRHAVRDGAGAQRRASRRWTRAGHGCHRRRGLHRGAAAGETGPPGRRRDRKGQRGALPAQPRRRRDPDRAELSGQGKPLQKERWSAAVDVVGSHTLANVLAQTRYGGAVAACGLAQGADLPATVMPFILRGVSLIGVDSVMAPLEIRNQAWQRLAKDLDLAMLETLTREIALAEAIPAAHELMAGRVRGRILVGTGNA